ncbi:hypothetical protein BDD12DRAFT_903117 [Trichophaea hybrida]|nr:hypothetical protein BDD12DRAFT_903117 [Trichophaea hybrida]
MSAALPPTKVLSSAAVLPSKAHTFLSTFILKADNDRDTSSRGNLVLSDQRRIEKALQGVFIPKPVEVLDVAGTALRTPEVTKAGKNAMEDVVNDEEAEETGESAEHHGVRVQSDDVPAPRKQSQSTGGVVDKEKRKADKKLRLKDEKKRRAEERAKERQ